MADLKDISLNGIGLELLADEAMQSPKGPSQFTANTREKIDRRQTEDRRNEFRFQENRRENKDRRPVKSWENGKNL